MKLQNLFESVRFFLNVDDFQSAYGDILSISGKASQAFFDHARSNHPFFYNHLRSKNFNIGFEPDGDDYDKPTGVLNIYPRNGTLNDHFKENFKDCLRATIQELKKHVSIGPVTAEGEKVSFDQPRTPFNRGDSMEKIGVIRIPIIKNERSESGTLPEISLSNTNARNLLNVLGLNDDDLVGTIEYNQIPALMMKIRNLSKDKKDHMERKPIVSSPNFYDGGVDSSRVEMYLENLLKVLETAMKMKVSVNYS